MTVMHEGRHPGEFVMSEASGQRSRENITIAAGTQTGAVVQLKGFGSPRLRGRGRGDLFVHVVVETPTELTEEQRELLATLAASRDETIGLPAPGEGIFSKLRSALS